jgi:subtilisin family serine protease
MAAPVVAGVAALVWSYYPELTYKQLKEVLLKSATRNDQPVIVPGSDPQAPTVVPFSVLSRTGGVVNAYEALQLAEKMVAKLSQK